MDAKDRCRLCQGMAKLIVFKPSPVMRKCPRCVDHPGWDPESMAREEIEKPIPEKPPGP